MLRYELQLDTLTALLNCGLNCMFLDAIITATEKLRLKPTFTIQTMRGTVALAYLSDCSLVVE
jgi:hypothetical protein